MLVQFLRLSLQTSSTADCRVGAARQTNSRTGGKRREKAKAGGRLIRGSTVSRPIAAGTKLAENMPRLRAPLINPAARAFRSRRGGRRGVPPRRAATENPRGFG